MVYERQIKLIPGYDHSDDPDPKQRKYGQHCPEFMFIVKNGRGAIVFQVSTGWYKMHKEASGASCRLAWHIPASANPLENLKHSVVGPVDCEIIGQKCVGSSCMDHDNKLYDLMRLGPLEDFWQALEAKHKEIICG